MTQKAFADGTQTYFQSMAIAERRKFYEIVARFAGNKTMSSNRYKLLCLYPEQYLAKYKGPKFTFWASILDASLHEMLRYSLYTSKENAKELMKTYKEVEARIEELHAFEREAQAAGGG